MGRRSVLFFFLACLLLGSSGCATGNLWGSYDGEEYPSPERILSAESHGERGFVLRIEHEDGETYPFIGSLDFADGEKLTLVADTPGKAAPTIQVLPEDFEGTLAEGIGVSLIRKHSVKVVFPAKTTTLRLEQVERARVQPLELAWRVFATPLALAVDLTTFPVQAFVYVVLIRREHGPS